MRVEAAKTRHERDSVETIRIWSDVNLSTSSSAKLWSIFKNRYEQTVQTELYNYCKIIDQEYISLWQLEKSKQRRTFERRERGVSVKHLPASSGSTLYLTSTLDSRRHFATIQQRDVRLARETQRGSSAARGGKHMP